MSNKPVYLKQNVLVEPLFNQWYAWSYLMPPVQAALYITNSHLKIMKSFVDSPQLHINALKNPAMMGGPFIRYDASRVNEIKTLLNRTLDDQHSLIELAEAIKSLQKILATEATGFSLEPLYQKVPEPLKGYVEMVYDMNNTASIRFIEGLLYKSPYYNRSWQSFDLSLINRDDRSFVYSTPRLSDDGHMCVEAPFDHEGVDELFEMKSVPKPLEHIKEMLNIRGNDSLFSSFFTEEAPAVTERYDGDGVRVRYFGHACLLIESNETSIITDPLVSYKFDTGIYRHTYADLPEKIDYAVITHNHQDHCMFETLLQLRHKIGTVVVSKSNGGSLADPSLKLILQSIGFRNVVEIDEMETLDIEGGSIMGLPFLGEHADLNVRTKLAYLITLKGKSVLCAADSNNIEPKLYENMKDYVKATDAVFLGMECDGAPLTWLYGPILDKPLVRKMDQSRRLDGSDFAKAIKMVEQLNPSQVYVYAMGQEPWLTYLTSIQYTEQSRPIIESNKLIEACRSRGIASERLFGHKDIFLRLS
jgi:L-ascorbate metabolism protein UlaG (beta-lactamase superfamily)